MADIGKLSATKITTYMGCSMAYALAYVFHEKVPTNATLLSGKSIHYMLDHFYDVNFKSEDSFAGYWRHYWGGQVSGDFIQGKEKEKLQLVEHEYFGRDPVSRKRVKKILRVGNHVDFGRDPVGIFFGHMKSGETMLRNFYSRHAVEKDPNNDERQPPVDRERNFGKRKDDPFSMDGIPIVGVFDRIDKKGEVWYITDYKTDRKSPGDDAFILHRHPQFTLYSYVFRKIYGVEESAILYYHLRSGDIFKTHRSEKDYDYLRRLISHVADGILHDRFVPFYGFHCNFCPYKVPCERYSTPYYGGPRIDLGGKIIGAEKFTDWDPLIPDWMQDQAEER